MELGKEEIRLGENKEQEKISIVIDGKKSDKKNTMQVDHRMSVEKKPLKDRMKEQFTSKKFRGGAFSSIFIVFILVAVVLVNMIVGQFDFQVDVTEEGTYTLTEQTEDVVENLKDDVTIYYIVENGKEAKLFKNIVDKYEELSDKVEVVYKDPVLYPNFATQYTGAGTEVNSNSIVVVSEATKKYKYIPYSQMYDLDYSKVYSGEATQPDTTAIDVEGQITAAIQVVTNENKSKIYVVNGHGESTLSDYLKNEFEKLGAETEFLNIRNIGNSDEDTADGLSNLVEDTATVGIPEDCDVLYICGPNTDYSKSEVEAIKAYMQGGGKVVIMLDFVAKAMTNFNSLLEYYGLKVIEGVVMENSTHSRGNIPYMSYADIVNENEITIGINNSTNPIMMPYSVGIQEAEPRNTVSVVNLLGTSSDAYCKTGDPSSITTFEKEETDVLGPFVAGALVTDVYNGAIGKMVVFSSEFVSSDEYVQDRSSGNVTLLNNTISFLAGQTTGLSIPKRSMRETYVNTTDANTVFYTIVLIIALPIILLTVGFLIWYMRRRRA